MNNASQPVNICSSSACVNNEEKKHTQNINDVNVTSETQIVEDFEDSLSIDDGEDAKEEEVLGSDNVVADELLNCVLMKQQLQTC